MENKIFLQFFQTWCKINTKNEWSLKDERGLAVKASSVNRPETITARQVIPAKHSVH